MLGAFGEVVTLDLNFFFIRTTSIRNDSGMLGMICPPQIGLRVLVVHWRLREVSDTKIWVDRLRGTRQDGFVFLDAVLSTGRRLNSLKLTAYRALVKERKECTRCAVLGLTNPASDELRHLDSDQVGPWTRWQGDLNADLMVVAQDWGDVAGFIRQSGVDNESATNRMLCDLLAHAGVQVTVPPASSYDSRVFLTNAVLCLKFGDAQTPVHKECFANCGSNFLRKQIEIVRPRVVVSLGEWAYRSIMKSFGMVPLRFRDAVDSVGPVALFHGTSLVPVYHCGRRILNTHRNREAQFSDWLRVQRALTEIPHATGNFDSQ